MESGLTTFPPCLNVGYWLRLPLASEILPAVTMFSL